MIVNFAIDANLARVDVFESKVNKTYFGYWCIGCCGNFVFGNFAIDAILAQCDFLESS